MERSAPIFDAPLGQSGEGSLFAAAQSAEEEPSLIQRDPALEMKDAMLAVARMMGGLGASLDGLREEVLFLREEIEEERTARAELLPGKAPVAEAAQAEPIIPPEPIAEAPPVPGVDDAELDLPPIAETAEPAETTREADAIDTAFVGAESADTSGAVAAEAVELTPAPAETAPIAAVIGEQTSERVVEPEPVVVTAGPVPAEPLAVEPAVEPEPVGEPEAVVEIEPLAVAVDVEPVAVEPEPVAVEILVEPELVALAEPVVVTESVVVTEPVAVEPVAVEPEPVALTEPVAVEPVVQPEPVVVTESVDVAGDAIERAALAAVEGILLDDVEDLSPAEAAATDGLGDLNLLDDPFAERDEDPAAAQPEAVSTLLDPTSASKPNLLDSASDDADDAFPTLIDEASAPATPEPVSEDAFPMLIEPATPAAATPEAVSEAPFPTLIEPAAAPEEDAFPTLIEDNTAASAPVEEVGAEDRPVDADEEAVIPNLIEAEPIAEVVEPVAVETGYQPSWTEPREDDEPEIAPLVVAPSRQMPEPRDILAVVAVLDPEQEEQRVDEEQFAILRQESPVQMTSETNHPEQRKAPELKPEPRTERKPPKKRKEKASAPVRYESLQFENLVEGAPLVLSMYSPAGGVGKSSSAMNLGVDIAVTAVQWAQERADRGLPAFNRPGRFLPDGSPDLVPRVLVIDGDVVTGSQALRLRGKTSPSMYDLLTYLDQRKAAQYQGAERWPSAYYEEHKNAGEQALREFLMWPKGLQNLSLLAAPDDPFRFFEMSEHDYDELIRLLGSFFDVIIIDCGTEIVMPSTRSWLKNSHQIFLLTTPEVDRLWNAKKAVKFAARPMPNPAGADKPDLPPVCTEREKFAVVMTSADAESGMEGSPKDILKRAFSVKRKDGKVLPMVPTEHMFLIDDYADEMRTANNVGRFLVTEDESFRRAIHDLAKHAFSRYGVSSHNAS